MALDFTKYTVRMNGDNRQPAAKMLVEFYVTRDDLVKGAATVLVDMVGWQAFHSDYIGQAAHVKRSLIENTVRSQYRMGGDAYMGDGDFTPECAYEVQALVLDLADQIVDRLYPELTN